MNDATNSSIQPKSIRQKKILNLADENPEATLAEIANEVPSATADHVGQVLEQFGDPAADDSDKTDDSSTEHNEASTNDIEMPESDSKDERKPETEMASESETPSKNKRESTVETEENQNETHEASTDQATASAPARHAVDPRAMVRTEHAVTAISAGQSSKPDPDGAVVDNERHSMTSKEAPTVGESSSEPTTDSETLPDLSELTQKERETLRAIYYEPRATQEQIAEMLDISRATVSNRVNAIPGFDWMDREVFVDDVFDSELTVDLNESPDAQTVGKRSQEQKTQLITDGSSNGNSESQPSVPNPVSNSNPTKTTAGSNSKTQTQKRDNVTETEGVHAKNDKSIVHKIEAISERLETIEQTVTESDSSNDSSPFGDAELVHKAFYACVNSDRVSQQEEIKILKRLIE